jgi:hypothetical protein
MEENYIRLLKDKQELEKMGQYLAPEKDDKLLNYEQQILDHFR